MPKKGNRPNIDLTKEQIESIGNKVLLERRVNNLLSASELSIKFERIRNGCSDSFPQYHTEIQDVVQLAEHNTGNMGKINSKKLLRERVEAIRTGFIDALRKYGILLDKKA